MVKSYKAAPAQEDARFQSTMALARQDDMHLVACAAEMAASLMYSDQDFLDSRVRAHAEQLG